MTKRCRSQIEKGSKTTFCSLERGHEGDHEGHKLTWKTGDPGVSEYEERPRKKKEEVPVQPTHPAQPKHEGPVWNASCQHCKHTFIIEVRPEQVTRSTSIVACPKCGQTGLYWFEQEPRDLKKGATDHVPAAAFDVGLKRSGKCSNCGRLYHQRFEYGAIIDYCPEGCLKVGVGTVETK